MTGSHGVTQPANGRRPITSRDLLDLRFVGDPRIAPDGDRVVWVERWIDADRNQYRSNLYAAPASGEATPAPLTTGPGIDRAPRWSPDGRWLAFLSDRPLPADGAGKRADPAGKAGGAAGRGDEKPRSQLYLLPAHGGEARLLTRFKQGVSPAGWSPDGRYLSVVAQVHPERGLEAVGDPEPGDDDPYRRYTRGVKVIRRLAYKLDGVGYFTEHRHHALVLDLGEGDAHLSQDAAAGAATVPWFQITAGEYDVRWVTWMPSGRELVVVTNPHPDADRQPWTDVYLVPFDPEAAAAGGAEPVDLSRDPLPAGVCKLTLSDIEAYEALPSPDGRWIAVRGQDARRYRAYSNTHLYLIAADGSQRRCLTAEADLTVGDESVNDIVGEPGAVMAWAPDGSGLYALVSRRGAVQLYWFGVDGTIRPLTDGPQVLRGISIDRAGRRCAYLRLTATEPGDVWIAELPSRDEPAVAAVGGGASTGTGAAGDGHPEAGAGSSGKDGRPAAVGAGLPAAGGATRDGHPVIQGRRLSRANDRWLAEVEVVEPEHFTFESDGNVLDGWLIRPVGFAPGKKYPAILQIHGGPMAMYGYAFFHEFQLLAARGYAVFYTNPRGSQGYGQDFCAAIRGDWGNRDYRDLMTFVDAVLERFDFIDRDRLGVAGGSYGGYMTNWIVTHTDRFRAGVTMRCVANEHSFFGTSDIGFYDLFDLEVPPWEDPLRYLEMSPLHHIGRCKTPLLVMHSEMDLRCPIEQAEQIYTALKVLGVPTEFVRFPDESHGLSRGGKPWHRVYRLDRIVDWFDRYLQPERPEGAGDRAEERAARVKWLGPVRPVRQGGPAWWAKARGRRSEGGGAQAMLIDYHMHLERGGLTREYLLRFVETARQRGIDEIGFTEHAYNFVEGAPLLGRPWYVERYSSGFSMADYIELLQSARAGGLPVKAGIEMDYIPGREEDIRAFLAAYPLDFVIGSVHWIDDWGFDLDPASWPGRDVREAYRRYFDLAERAIRSGLFDVFGHPDVIKVFGYKLPPEHRDELAEYHRRLARAAAETGVCLEISSAGVRKPVGEFYPDPGILDEARRLGVRVTLASDAHEPEHVGWAYPELVAYARAHGFETVTVFEGRVGRQEPLG